MPGDTESKHIIKLFYAPANTVKIIENGKEVEEPGIQIPGGVYEKIMGSYLYRGRLCLYQDGNCYNLDSLPANFTVYGDLNLSGLNLQVLPDLSPAMVLGTFNCSRNSLKNLKGSPKYAKKYICSVNFELTSLLGATKTVDEFDCSTCPRLRSLESIPHARIYTINGNPQLTYAPSKSKLVQNAPAGALLFDALPDEFDTLNVQDGPATINIKGKKIKIIDISYNFRRKNLIDIPEDTEQVMYNNCASLTQEAIKEYNQRRRTYLELQSQMTIEF